MLETRDGTKLKVKSWILPVPFKGSSQTCTFVCPKTGIEKTVWSNVPVDEYMMQLEGAYQIVSDDEFDQILDDYEKNTYLCRPIEEVTSERYWEMLEVLPPCRWVNDRFHVSERMTGDIVSWFMKVDGKYYEFNHYASISSAKLEKIRKAISSASDVSKINIMEI